MSELSTSLELCFKCLCNVTKDRHIFFRTLLCDYNAKIILAINDCNVSLLNFSS